MTKDAISVFEHDRISVWWRPRENIIHHQMHKHVFGDIFQQALLKGIAAMREHKGCKWLSDDRLNRALAPEDLTWADEVWSEKAIQAGWKYWALLPPVDAIGQMNIRRHIKLYADRGITVQVFKELDEAQSWLVSL